MPKPNKPATPAHLAAVPTPLHGGDGAAWMPAPALLILAERNGVPLDHDGLRANVAESRKRWTAYRDALRAADAMHHGDVKADARRIDALALTYNRARLGAWTAALPGEGDDDGRHHYALAIAQSTLDARLAKRTRGAITSDLLPDLPRRCDLTDAADDVTRDLREGATRWSTLKRRLEAAADACLDEALADIGWRDSMAD
jgi:hypothetical protein